MPVITPQEKELFEGKAQQKLNTILHAAAGNKPLRERRRDGNVYGKFKEEFKDIFESKLDEKKIV